MEDRFKITCLRCGSEDVSIKEDIAYDYNENPFITGYYLECNDCKEQNLF